MHKITHILIEAFSDIIKEAILAKEWIFMLYPTSFDYVPERSLVGSGLYSYSTAALIQDIGRKVESPIYLNSLKNAAWKGQYKKLLQENEEKMIDLPRPTNAYQALENIKSLKYCCIISNAEWNSSKIDTEIKKIERFYSVLKKVPFDKIHYIDMP